MEKIDKHFADERRILLIRCVALALLGACIIWAATANAQDKEDSLYKHTFIGDYKCHNHQKIKADTPYTSFDSLYAAFNKKLADTAHYWVKPINDFTKILMPARDTLECFIELIISPNQRIGDIIETGWYFGYVTRRHEQVQSFLYADKATAMYREVLNYKIVTK